MDRTQREAPDREMEALEARVRMKLEMGQPLTREEAEFFARMPADKGLDPSWRPDGEA